MMQHTQAESPYPDPLTLSQQTAAGSDITKSCSRCGQTYPLSHYLKRTGRKSGRSSRRGTCRRCRKQLKKNADVIDAPQHAQPPGAPLEGASAERSPSAASPIAALRPVRQLPSIEPKDIRGQGLDLSVLRSTRRGIVHMRGRTDKGRRWHQETDLATATILVKEYAAVVVNPYTIRRLYSNRSFRKYILERDQYTCYFCSGPGDTIDHLLPRARGGHTTPLNCVCACNLCNQAKADHDLHHFIQPDQSGYSNSPSDDVN